MSELDKLPATKSNLLKLKKDLAIYKVGWEILKQKRELLINELLSFQYSYEEINNKVIDLFNRNNDNLINILKFHFFEPKETDLFDIDIKSNSIMGVLNLDIDFNMNENFPFNDSLEGIGPKWDLIVINFQKLFEFLSKWLELYSTMYRLLNEIERTSKRVRSLENIFIPDYNRTLKRLQDQLEEKEREEFVRKKKVKEKKK